MKIALDAMGGDFGPPNLVAGAVMALRDYRQINKLHLVGDTTEIENELGKHQCNDSRIDIVHSTQVVEMSDRAWTAVRRKKDSSVSRAVDLVKRGDADAVVSAGHTGAAVAASMIKLRTLEGIDRPGIAALLPTQFNVFVLVDAGANIDARPEHLLQYGIMGSVYSSHVLRYNRPRVGLISLGEEDVKGNDLTKEAFKMLKASSINFLGNIEGRHLFEDPVEVVVCDGFVGNVILKTSESIAVAIFKWLKQELTRSKIHMVGAYLARKAFRVIKDKTNYEEYGGMPLLGVNGICIIAHGASTPLAIKNALRVATATPDMLFPATACFVQKKIGATNAACLDISAACAGFLFGLEIAQQFITSHTHDTVLVIGAEKLTSITNWTDRNSCVLFGDGAGAAVLRHRGSAHGVISTHIGSDGRYTDILFMPGGGSRCPITRDNVDMHLATIHMTGKEVYKQAVTAMLNAAKKALDQAGLSIEDIACVIPHQANLRIMEAIADRLGISRDKMFVNLDRYGNTSAAAVAIALDEANRTGRIKRGDYVLMVVFGGGLTWASTVIEW